MMHGTHNIKPWLLVLKQMSFLNWTPRLLQQICRHKRFNNAETLKQIFVRNLRGAPIKFELTQAGQLSNFTECKNVRYIMN